jgi:hypothetical protein
MKRWQESESEIQAWAGWWEREDCTVGSRGACHQNAAKRIIDKGPTSQNLAIQEIAPATWIAGNALSGTPIIPASLVCGTTLA